MSAVLRLCLAAFSGLCLCGGSLFANPPIASYLFPAGGQRGTTVSLRVGGLFLNKKCGFELLGPGVEAERELRRVPTLWFEGPMLPLPDSQRAEDYPQDMAGRVRIAADAPIGLRRGRLWTAEGAASGLWFQVGELPEIVEEEIDGDPVPVEVRLPVTINGRIFPRQDVDVWSFRASKGQTISAEVFASRLGSPLDSRLTVLDPDGRVIAENDDAFGADSFVSFTAAADGLYSVRIQDSNQQGSPAHVYRLTLTAGPHIAVYPLGGRRGSTVRFTASGPGVPAHLEAKLPDQVTADYSHRFAVGLTHTSPVRLDVDDLPEHLEAEPNDAPASAPLIALPAVLNGRIDRPGDVDCWRFERKKGQAWQFELRASRLGSRLAGVLSILDPAGKVLASAEGKPGQVDPSLTFTLPADGTYSVQVRDRFRSRGGPDFGYRLRITAPPAPGFQLHLIADALTLARGGQGKLRVTAERSGGFTGPIDLSFEDLPAGIQATNLKIAAGQNQVEVALKAEAAAAIGASRVRVRGSAMVADRALTETATLAGTPGQPETDTVLLAVALPVPFKVVADYQMSWSSRGSVHRRKYRIERNGYDGPLEVRLADRQARHLQGVTGPVLTVPTGATEFEYAVQLPPWMEIGRTCRVCIMASAVIKDGDREHEVSFSAIGQNDQIVTVIEAGKLNVETTAASVAAAPGKTVSVPIKVLRGKGLSGPVRVELVLPAHVRGVQAEPMTIAEGQGEGTLAIRFAGDSQGPFNMPATIRATLETASGPVFAETRLELAPAAP
jgi:hypothetical protein